MGCLWSDRKCHNSHSTCEDSSVNGKVFAIDGKNIPYSMKEDDMRDYTRLEVDPRLPFNKKQIFKLLQSWRAIKRNIGTTGVEMFVQLFKTNSSLQTMFQGFKDIRSDDELRSNEALEYHATLVMTTLDDAITHIDNYDFVRSLLHRTGGSHVKFAGFKAENFLAIKGPFLEAVRVTLGDRYTDNMQNIYTVAITFILQTLVEGMEEALGKEQNRGSNSDANSNGAV